MGSPLTNQNRTKSRPVHQTPVARKEQPKKKIFFFSRRLPLLLHLMFTKNNPIKASTRRSPTFPPPIRSNRGLLQRLGSAVNPVSPSPMPGSNSRMISSLMRPSLVRLASRNPGPSLVLNCPQELLYGFTCSL
ncbi:hypothetical protein M5K25_022784 [Dendrobium thyrsiflorum]|uniref:Uncharacterized protein n=1 Tax=Dendrobium thyrsiflorum TaxID=117978 RepID=A0ABD0U6T2_DENTH